MNQPMYLTYHDLAERFGVSRAAIRDWHEQGNFPKPYRIGRRRYRFLASEIDEYMTNQCPRGHETTTVPCTGGGA